VTKKRKAAKMKYPCSDGVNRDRAITQYLRVDAELGRVRAEIDKLEAREQELFNQIKYLRLYDLGAIGIDAVNEARKTAESEGPC
jgi:cell division protein FtsB